MGEFQILVPQFRCGGQRKKIDVFYSQTRQRPVLSTAISRAARVPQRNPVGRVSQYSHSCVNIKGGTQVFRLVWQMLFTCLTILKPWQIVIVEVVFIFFVSFESSDLLLSMFCSYVCAPCVCLVSKEGIGSFGTGLCVGFSHHVGPGNQDLWKGSKGSLGLLSCLSSILFVLRRYCCCSSGQNTPASVYWQDYSTIGLCIHRFLTVLSKVRFL